MFDLGLWMVFLAVSLFVLIRGADMFVIGAKQMGASLGMSRFAIGVLIVGFGTSLPELSSSVIAALSGAGEIVVASVVGSNITNILFVVGILAALGGKISIKRDLIKTELPVFFIAAVLFIAVVFDGTVDRIEAALLLGTFGAYLWYLFAEAEQTDEVDLIQEGRRPRLEAKSVAFIVFGIGALLFGAKFTVDMVVNIAEAIAVPIDLVSIFAIALGTSLPELFVSLQAIRSKEVELAIGNIFGSNAFNMLMVVGLSGVFVSLPVGAVVMGIGLPVLIAASLILFVNGLAKRIMQWEGIMLLLFFGFFMVKLFEFL